MVVNIRVAHTDEEVLACFPVMRTLRTHLVEEEFVARIRRQQTTGGYRLIYILDDTNNKTGDNRLDQDSASGGVGEKSSEVAVVAVAGFRVHEMLSRGKFLYVDDLVTSPEHRSKGYGSEMLSWLKATAAAEGCQQLDLDSGCEKKDAHRFYQREGMAMPAFHFNFKLE